MKLEIGKFYKIVVSVNNTILTYTCEVTDIDDNFVSFRDKYNKDFTYNLNAVISYEVQV